MALLDDMGAVYVGDIPLQRIYKDGSEVWPKTPVQLSGSSPRWDIVDLTITPPGGPAVDSYVIKRNGTQVYSGTATTYRDEYPKSSLMPLTQYTYTVDAIRGGTVRSSASKTVTTLPHTDIGLNYSNLAWNFVSLRWTDSTQGTIDKYSLYKNGAWLEDSANPGDKACDDGALTSRTPYTYEVRCFRGGVEIPSRDSVSFTTPARLITKVWEDYTYWSASYNGVGAAAGSWAKRMDNDKLYYGRYDSNRGHQQSGGLYSIPGEIRNCHAIVKVEISWRAQYVPWAGDNACVLLQTNGDWPSIWPGSTQRCCTFGIPGPDTWWGGAEWMEITGYTVPDWGVSIAEGFRSRGATGIGIASPVQSTNDYGYFYHAAAPHVRPRLRITYQVWVKGAEEEPEEGYEPTYEQVPPIEPPPMKPRRGRSGREPRKKK